MDVWTLKEKASKAEDLLLDLAALDLAEKAGWLATCDVSLPEIGSYTVAIEIPPAITHGLIESRRSALVSEIQAIARSLNLKAISFEDLEVRNS